MRAPVRPATAPGNDAGGSNPGPVQPSAAEAVVQRVVSLGSVPAVTLVSGSPPPELVRRSVTTTVEAPSGNGTGAAPAAVPTAGPDASSVEELSTTALLDRVDEMMSQLEERILEELERRGGRFTGYF